MALNTVNVPVPANSLIKLVPTTGKNVQKSDGHVAQENDGNVEKDGNTIASSAGDIGGGLVDANMVVDATEKNPAVVAAEAAQKDQERLEALAIKAARTSATGKLIKSAEPYNFWTNPTEVPKGLRPLGLSVLFNIGWGSVVMTSSGCSQI